MAEDNIEREHDSSAPLANEPVRTLERRLLSRFTDVVPSQEGSYYARSEAARPSLGGFRGQRVEAVRPPKMQLSPFHRTSLMAPDLTTFDHGPTELQRRVVSEDSLLRPLGDVEDQPVAEQNDRLPPEIQAGPLGIGPSSVEETQPEESVPSVEAEGRGLDKTVLSEDAEAAPASGQSLDTSRRDRAPEMPDESLTVGNTQHRSPELDSEESSSLPQEVGRRPQSQTPGIDLRASERISTPSADAVEGSESAPVHLRSTSSPIETSARSGSSDDEIAASSASPLGMETSSLVPDFPVSADHLRSSNAAFEEGAADAEGRKSDRQLARKEDRPTKVGKFVAPREHRLSDVGASKIIPELSPGKREPSINIGKINVNVVNTSSKAEEPSAAPQILLPSEAGPGIGSDRFEVLDRNYLTKLKLFY